MLNCLRYIPPPTKHTRTHTRTIFTHIQITAIWVIVCVHVCLCMCACSSYMTTVNTFYSFTKANFYLCLASVHFGPRIEMKRFTQPLSVVMDDICLLKTHRAPYERHKRWSITSSVVDMAIEGWTLCLRVNIESDIQTDPGWRTRRSIIFSKYVCWRLSLGSIER